MMKMRRWVVLWALALSVLVAAGCSDGNESGSGARATPAASEPTEATLLPDIVGPVLVYEIDLPTLSTHAAREIVAYDLGARREVSRETLDTTSGAAVLSRQRGEVIVPISVPDGARIDAIDVLRRTRRTVYNATAQLEWSLAVSPDGQRVALTEVEQTDATPVDFDPDTRRVIAKSVDLVGGGNSTLLTRDLGFAPDGFTGPPVPRYWRDDGAGILMSEDTSSARPGGWITIRLDGSYGLQISANMPEAIDAWPSTNGRIMLLRDGGLGEADCISVANTHRVVLRDLDADPAVDPAIADVAVAEDALHGIDFLEWSPDGDAALFGAYPVIPGETCPNDVSRNADAYFTLTVGKRGATPVADLRALREQWHPGRVVEFRCTDTATKAGDDGSCPPFDDRAVLVNGVPVDAGRGIRVLGFLD